MKTNNLKNIQSHFPKVRASPKRTGYDNKVCETKLIYRAPYQKNLVFDIPAHNKILVVEFFSGGLFSADV